MYVDGLWLKDADGRTRILRGANLGGSSKVPFTPDGATYRSDGFFDPRNVSFVGRPFPLDQADAHLSRLRAWGMTFLRFLVTWEAVEHAAPGVYDTDYLDYLYAVIRKAADYGIEVFIDPHQDVWSRWTGGDGAPGWTLEAVGMDLTHLHETGAAISHQTHGDPYPRMIWITNRLRLGAATMFTLFFAGNDFAPATLIDGVPVQEYLQSHYIESIRQVALRLKDLPNVVGYDTLNEPNEGWIGCPDITVMFGNPFFRNGVTLTPFQAMMAAGGHPVEASIYEMGFGEPQVVSSTTVNPDGVRLWREGKPDLWQQNGVWTDEGGEVEVMQSDHFARVNGRTPDFVRDYLKPFTARCADAIRSVSPDAVLFVEGVPGDHQLHWDAADPSNAVCAGHWYDGITLLTKHFNPDFTIDVETRQMIEGVENVAHTFVKALAHIQQAATESSLPTLIGEFGIPFDLDEGQAYRDGDYSAQVQALDMYYDAMDAHLLSCTLWNYTADNSNAHGDQWNGEDLSIFSPDQQTDAADSNSGGRGLAAIVRPYAMRIAGEPLRMTYEHETREFLLEYRHDPAVEAPTEIFVPEYQYPDGIAVELSDGRYVHDRAAQTLLVWHISDTATHTVKITPAHPV